MQTAGLRVDVGSELGDVGFELAGSRIETAVDGLDAGLHGLGNLDHARVEQGNALGPGVGQ